MLVVQRPEAAVAAAEATVVDVRGGVLNGAVGVFSGGLGRALARSARLERGLRYATATIFGALALRLVLEGRRG